MDYNISRLCRVCLEEGVFTSIFNTDLVAMAPADMLVMCANIKVMFFIQKFFHSDQQEPIVIAGIKK